MKDEIVPGLHPLLAARWSPTMFDPIFELDADHTELLVEAARWAPSAGNSQPWAFIVSRRGDDAHPRLVRHLAASSARWAPSASVLVANLSHRYVEGTDWEYSEFAQYDLGQAVAHMTVQAQALGLFARQFRAFDRKALENEFGVPDHWEITTMSAFGRVPDGTGSSARRPLDPARIRRPAGELLWTE
ncbi:nitroreductase family protein [Winogradskya consettensis]|uniref:Oxidoreductase n=1 Tax=Winogradskya consettensis TaxID=113560 RepID=A0A919SSQ0_9ACTN|nr:nitroreductase family protein [Actinoplanes consettensis]GIM76879.1 oxidoreductase [Actinoplanes consettensis]